MTTTMVFFCTDLEVGTRCGNNCLPSGLYSTKLSAYIRHIYIRRTTRHCNCSQPKYLLRRKRRRRATGAMQYCPTKHPVPGSQVEKVHVSRKGRPALRIVPVWCHHTVVVMQDRPPFHLQDQVRSSQVKTTTTSTSA